MLTHDRVVRVPLRATTFRLLLQAAATRLPAEFMNCALCEISVADCDGRALASWTGAWAGHTDKPEPELGLLAFCVSFRNGRGEIVTVCVETAA